MEALTSQLSSYRFILFCHPDRVQKITEQSVYEKVETQTAYIKNLSITFFNLLRYPANVTTM